MATHVWRGDAPVVRDFWTITPVASNNATYTVTINGKSVTYTADGTALESEITAGLVAALEASTIPEFVEVDWADITTALTATGPTTGKPVTITCAASAGSLTPVNTTPAEGPNHWAADNFDSGSLPVSTDTVILQDSAVSVLYGIDQNAVDLALLIITSDFASPAQVGLPRVTTGSSSYFEYRDQYLAIGADAVRIGEGKGQMSGLMKLNLGTGATSVQVFSTGNPADQDYGALQLLAVNSANVLQVFAGTVDVAMGPGEASEFATITVSGGTVRLGPDVTVATVEASDSATVEIRGAATTLNTYGSGRIIKLGSGAVTNITVKGGPVSIQAAGTITNLTLFPGCILDCSKLNVAVTITNATLHAGAKIIDPNGRVTLTNVPTRVGGTGIQNAG